ncbi:MAG: hypothetical protein RL021_1028 [Bacteroidota bacterium]|jgi:hypothetical protein
MMKRHLLSLFIAINALSRVHGQHTDIRNEYALPDSARYSVGLSSEYFFASDALTNRLAQDYLLHRFIDDPVKDAVSEQSSDLNRFGLAFNGAIEFLHRPDSSKTHYIFSLQHHLFVDSKFRNDLFDLYFRGNKPFAGDTAYVRNSSFRLLFYYQAGAGAAGSSLNGKIRWYGLGSFLIGHDLLDVKATNGWIYTSPDGEFIDSDMHLTFRQSDSAGTAPTTMNGAGASMTAGISVATGENGRIHFGVRNLGFIHFFERSSFAEVDTNLRFEGIDATDLFDFSDSITGIIDDSTLVQQYIVNRRKESFNAATPGQIDLWHEQGLLKNNLSLALGTRLYLRNTSIPLVWTEVSVRLSPHHTFRLRAQYGGYTELTAGPGFEYDNGKWNFRIGSDFLSEWLDAEKGTAQGAFLSLQKSF